MSTLLFIHGSGCTGDVFQAQTAAFAGSHAPNLPGHDAPGSAHTISDFATFIQSYIVAHGLTRVVLCGNSLGGAVALEVGLRNDAAVSAIVVLGSGCRLKVAPAFLSGLEHNFEQTARQLAGFMFADATPARTEEIVASMMRVGKPQTLADFVACNAFDVCDRLPELSLPVLAITGEHDVMTPPKFATSLASRVPAGDVRIIPGAGHLVMMERAAETNDAIKNFVQQVG
ncbi:MAG: alpha/beta hydrolase [Candidatus Eremiobacteraeota bacterium]|nr:alpha/beta hydrolase [Candidatus Eremiobacteraeota bacterium]